MTVNLLPVYIANSALAVVPSFFCTRTRKPSLWGPGSKCSPAVVLYGVKLMSHLCYFITSHKEKKKRLLLNWNEKYQTVIGYQSLENMEPTYNHSVYSNSWLAHWRHSTIAEGPRVAVCQLKSSSALQISLCSAVYGGCKRDTARLCCCPPCCCGAIAAGRWSPSNRSISCSQPGHSSKPAARYRSGR